MSSIRLPLICKSFEELVTHYDANADGEEGSDGASVTYTVQISPELYFLQSHRHSQYFPSLPLLAHPHCHDQK